MRTGLDAAAERRTIYDVARIADVSIKTVSRVLNDEPSVRPATRDRVLSVMTLLNYQPSLHARSLASRRSNLLALVIQNPSANYFFDVQSGAMAKCRAAHQRLLVQSCDGQGAELIDDVLAMAAQTHVDGAVITPPLSANRELIAALDERRIPFVRIAPDEVDHVSPAVVIDDEAAAREMTAFLLRQGHRSIGFVAGHPAHHSGKLRLDGFRAELASQNGGVAFMIEQGYYTVKSGREAGRRLLDRSDRPTAVFAANDDMAVGVLSAAQERGLRVPEDLSVAGFDDTPIASAVFPALTTVHQPVYDMAFAATALLIDTIRGRHAQRTIRLRYTLIERGSTAPARI